LAQKPGNQENPISQLEEIFLDLNAYLFENTKTGELERSYRIIGQTDSGRILTAAFTIRHHENRPKIRIITSWDASRQERCLYHGQAHPTERG
jgi:uncharacterized DUF497 family protein